jgi:fermentation-respiration switch protein FrsA (DUF1100 family)
MHGDIDEVIPVWSAERLFHRAECLPKELQIVPGLTHYVPCPEIYLSKLQAFLEGLD